MRIFSAWRSWKAASARLCGAESGHTTRPFAFRGMRHATASRIRRGTSAENAGTHLVRYPTYDSNIGIADRFAFPLILTL
jgi:hypothetical protein